MRIPRTTPPFHPLLSSSYTELSSFATTRGFYRVCGGIEQCDRSVWIPVYNIILYYIGSDERTRAICHLFLIIISSCDCLWMRTKGFECGDNGSHLNDWDVKVWIHMNSDKFRKRFGSNVKWDFLRIWLDLCIDEKFSLLVQSLKT